MSSLKPEHPWDETITNSTTPRPISRKTVPCSLPSQRVSSSNSTYDNDNDDVSSTTTPTFSNRPVTDLDDTTAPSTTSVRLRRESEPVIIPSQDVSFTNNVFERTKSRLSVPVVTTSQKKCFTDNIFDEFVTNDPSFHNKTETEKCAILSKKILVLKEEIAIKRISNKWWSVPSTSTQITVRRLYDGHVNDYEADDTAFENILTDIRYLRNVKIKTENEVRRTVPKEMQVHEDEMYFYEKEIQRMVTQMEDIRRSRSDGTDVHFLREVREERNREQEEYEAALLRKKEVEGKITKFRERLRKKDELRMKVLHSLVQVTQERNSAMIVDRDLREEWECMKQEYDKLGGLGCESFCIFFKNMLRRRDMDKEEDSQPEGQDKDKREEERKEEVESLQEKQERWRADREMEGVVYIADEKKLLHMKNSVKNNVEWPTAI